jgi:hypothetical protein
MHEFIDHMATRGVVLTPEDFFPETGRGGAVGGGTPSPTAGWGIVEADDAENEVGIVELV